MTREQGAFGGKAELEEKQSHASYNREKGVRAEVRTVSGAMRQFALDEYKDEQLEEARRHMLDLMIAGKPFIIGDMVVIPENLEFVRVCLSENR